MKFVVIYDDVEQTGWRFGIRAYEEASVIFSIDEQKISYLKNRGGESNDTCVSKDIHKACGLPVCEPIIRLIKSSKK